MVCYRLEGTGRCVAHKTVQVVECISVQVKELSKWIVVKDRKETLLVKSIDVDVGGDSVALSLGVRQPRLSSASRTRIVNAVATLSKGAVADQRDS